MENQFTNQQQTSENIPMSMNHGAHEVMDVHEVLSASIGALNMFVMLRPHVQDPELLNILDRQYAFMLDEYNITAECFKTGQDPSHPTRKYCMQIGNDSKYGLTPSEPKKPITSANEIDDSIISGFMLSQHKALATGKTFLCIRSYKPSSTAAYCKTLFQTALKWHTNFHFTKTKKDIIKFHNFHHKICKLC